MPSAKFKPSRRLAVNRLTRKEKNEIIRASTHGRGPRGGWTPEMLARKEQALGANPSGGFNHDALGCEFSRVGLWDKAACEFEKAVSINPWNAIFKFHLARAYLATEDFDNAECMAEAAQAQEPTLAAASLAVALVRERRGDRAQACLWYERCLSLNPEYFIKKEAEENLALLHHRKVAAKSDSGITARRRHEN
jgi:tetratricopeptide (TPR) repeat protein